MKSDYQELVKLFYIGQYNLLKCFALWDLGEEISPFMRRLYRFYFWTILTSWTLPFSCGMLIQLILNIGDVFEVIKVSIFFATSTAALIKYISIKMGTRDYENIFQMLHQQEFLPQNLREWKEYRKAIDLSRQVWKVYATLSISSISSLFLIQFFNTEREFNVSLYNPLNMESDVQYFMMGVYQLLSLTAVCFVNLCFDSLAASFFINIKGQLDVLGCRLENIGQGVRCSQEEVLRQLKDCIIYYQRLLDLTHTMEELLRV
ncbi:uncharacterized protein LOC106091251, partial [Stomoxys calcitrans]|uniref:uncharacterized protein LOC106091251 n=1 Tax=Stomoxys calcitrans TaxID=35570 RepID=UPI0027E22321